MAVWIWVLLSTDSRCICLSEGDKKRWELESVGTNLIYTGLVISPFGVPIDPKGIFTTHLCLLKSKSSTPRYSRGYIPEDTCILKIKQHTRVESMNRWPWTIQPKIRTSSYSKVEDQKEWKEFRRNHLNYTVLYLPQKRMISIEQTVSDLLS